MKARYMDEHVSDEFPRCIDPTIYAEVLVRHFLNPIE
jgi:hypothetical protein